MFLTLSGKVFQSFDEANVKALVPKLSNILFSSPDLRCCCTVFIPDVVRQYSSQRLWDSIHPICCWLTFTPDALRQHSSHTYVSIFEPQKIWTIRSEPQKCLLYRCAAHKCHTSQVPLIGMAVLPWTDIKPICVVMI